MFGNSYTAVVVQVNGERIAREIWTRLGDMNCVTEFERMRVSYHDLAIMVLQSDGETANKYKDVLFKMIRDKYGRLIDNHSVFMEVCPDIQKNTFSRGKVFEEEVDSLECVRLSLVFHGFSDILPFLTIFNAAVRSPPANARPPPSQTVPYPPSVVPPNSVPRLPQTMPRQMPPSMPQPGARPMQPGARPIQQSVGPIQPGSRPMQPGSRPMQPGVGLAQPPSRPIQPGPRFYPQPPGRPVQPVRQAQPAQPIQPIQQSARPCNPPNVRPSPPPNSYPSQPPNARPSPLPGVRPLMQPNDDPAQRYNQRFPMNSQSPPPRIPLPPPGDYPRNKYIPRVIPPHPSFPINPHRVNNPEY